MIVFLILLALIAPIVVVEPLQDTVVLPKLATTAAFTGAALIWGAVLLVRDRWRAPRWPAWLWVVVVAFVAVNVLAFAFARDWRWSLIGERLRYQGLATTLLYVLLFGVAAVSVRTTRELRWLVLGLFAGGLGVAIYALIQKAGLDPFDNMWVRSAEQRPAATLGQANAFGAYLVAAISASAYLLFAVRARWQQALVAGGLVIMLFALFFTVSRSAFLAAGVLILFGGVAFAWWTPGLRARLSAPAVRGALATAAALPLLLALAGVFLIGLPQGRVSVANDANSQAVDGRLSLWRLGLKMTADRPLLGHGQDAYTLLFARYRDRPDLPGIGTQSIEPESAHNLFVDLAADTGLLGLLAFAALVAAVLWYALRRTLSTADAQLRAALLALSGGVVGYLIAVFFGFSEAMTTWLFWLLLGSIAGLVVQAGADKEAREPAAAGPPAQGEAPRGQAALASGVAAVMLTLVGVLALGWAATLVAADLAAKQSTAAEAHGHYATAARLAGRAVRLNPLVKTYLAQKAAVDEAAGLETDQRVSALQASIGTHETLLRRFEPGAYDVLGLALAKYHLAQIDGTPVKDTFDLFERAVSMDPYNRDLHAFMVDLYEREGFHGAAELHRVVLYCWSVHCG